MKKILKFFLKGLLFIAGFAVAAWIFMPWKQVGEGALLWGSARLQAPSSLTYSTVKGTSGGFVIEDLKAMRVNGLADITFRTLSVRPSLLATLANMAPTCRISFTGNAIGEIAVTPLKKIPGIAVGNGRFSVSAGRKEILLDDLRSDGDLAMNGALLLDLAAERPIRWADVALNVKSEAFEKELPALQNFLPLQQEAPGRWYLRRAMGGGDGQ